MKIENLKIYASALALVAGLSLAPVSSLNVNAEEEVLFEDTEDDYTLEDIPESEVPPVIEEQSTPASSEEKKEEEKVESPSTVDWENTTIDEEDEKYDTGRTEVPDYVETEWERKNKSEEPTPKPSEPTPEPTKPSEETPSTPSTTVTTTTPVESTTVEETTVTPETETEEKVIPKTGYSVKSVAGIAFASGLIVGGIIGLKYEYDLSKVYEGKVVSSRKKYRKNSKKKSR